MIWIVVPAFNEENKIGRVVRGLFEQGFKNILVIDDGSSDNTFIEARKNGVKVLKHLINRGQGAALETANEYLRNKNADIVVHFDGDNQFNPVDILGAVKKIETGECDVVLGSRFFDNRSNLPFFKRFFILPIARIINFLFTGVWLSDAHNGFRVLNKKSLNKISITQDGMAHNTEILKQIKKNNLNYKEYPVEVRYEKFGQGITGGLKIVWDLLVN